MSRRIWWRNKPVTIGKQEILAAFNDLLIYWESQEQTNNITAAIKATKEILRNEVKKYDKLYQGSGK